MSTSSNPNTEIEHNSDPKQWKLRAKKIHKIILYFSNLEGEKLIHCFQAYLDWHDSINSEWETAIEEAFKLGLLPM